MIKKYKKLELLNSEGPILTAFDTEDGYVLYDKEDSIVDILTHEEMKNFISGELTVYYTDGKAMVYPSYSKDMRADDKRLKEFLKF